MHILQLPQERLDAFEQALVDRAGKHLETKGEHEAFRIEMGRWTVVAWPTGKVGVADEELLPVIEEVLEEILEPAEGTVVGSDEAGKGEWLGPLVVGACAVPPGARAGLVADGVMDSKDLGGDRIRALADDLEREQQTSVVLVSPSRFNELYADLKAEGKGLNDLIAWAHARALGDLLETLEDADEGDGVRVVVDEFDRVRTAARTQRAFDVDRYPVEQRVRAEDEVAVAAASILARAARERWIDAYEQREGIPVRSFDRDEARGHEKRGEFAKVQWL